MAEKLGVSLALAGNHGQSGFRRLVLGSVTERLMRTLACPLLVMSSPEHDPVGTADREFKLKKILVGCDFSPDSDQAFNHGLSLAQEFQSELHLAHVIEPPAQPDWMRFVDSNRPFCPMAKINKPHFFTFSTPTIPSLSVNCPTLALDLICVWWFIASPW